MPFESLGRTGAGSGGTGAGWRGGVGHFPPAGIRGLGSEVVETTEEVGAGQQKLSGAYPLHPWGEGAN